MDSLSPSSTAAPADERLAAQPVAASTGARVTSLDLGLRMVLSGLLIGLFVRQVGTPSLSGMIYPLLMYGLLSVAYLLLSLPPIARGIQRRAKAHPLAMTLLALAPLLPAVIYARFMPDLNASDILFGGLLIFLPVGLAVLNTPHLRRGDISLGLMVVALPLILPLMRASESGLLAAPAPGDWPVRLGAFLLPVAVLVFTTREQKQQLNFLFLCGAVALWCALAFRAFPEVPFLPESELSYLEFIAIPVFLYLLALAGRFDRLGMSFQPSPRQVSVVSANAGLLATIGIPFGLAVGLLVPTFAGPPLPEVVAKGLQIFLLVALPAEIFFRGTLLTFFQDVFRLNTGLTIAVNAVIFGLAQWNAAIASAAPVAYLALAMLAGVFLARTFLTTQNVVAAAIVQTFALWIMWLFFNG